MHYQFSYVDVILLLTTLASFYQWLVARKLLPAKVVAFVNKLPMAGIREVIFRAKALADMSDDQRREYAVDQLLALADREDIILPEGYARLIVEFFYQRIVKKRL